MSPQMKEANYDEAVFTSLKSSAALEMKQESMDMCMDLMEEEEECR